MKIISIKINPNTPIVEVGNRKLTGVIITTQSWFGRIDTFEAYPSTRAKVRKKDDSLLFIHFTDKLGAFLDEEISEQINNFFTINNNFNIK